MDLTPCYRDVEDMSEIWMNEWLIYCIVDSKKDCYEIVEWDEWMRMKVGKAAIPNLNINSF